MVLVCQKSFAGAPIHVRLVKHRASANIRIKAAMTGLSLLNTLSNMRYRSPESTHVWASHSWYLVPASQRGVSLIHLATSQPALPSPQAFHPSRGTPGRDLVDWMVSPALPGSAPHSYPDR